MACRHPTQAYATHKVTKLELTVTRLLDCNTQVYATHEVTKFELTVMGLLVV